MKSKKRIVATGVIFLSLCFLMGSGSCQPTPQEVCSVWIPEWKEELQEQMVQLDRLASNRMIASETPPETLEEWQEWALDQLKHTQRSLDASGGTRDLIPASKTLGRISNYWIGFYGYARSGRWSKMKETLAHIQTESFTLQSQLCGDR